VLGNARPSLTNALNSSGVAPASLKAAYRALLERAGSREPADRGGVDGIGPRHIGLRLGGGGGFAKRGVGFRSLQDTWADTTTPHGKLMVTVLGGLAEFERELIRARTGEGGKRAKERGVRFGRPRKMTPHQRQEALQRLAAGETQADVARTYAVDAATISRLAAASPFEQGAIGGLQ
jgi:Resolvase, N terminal domain